MQRDGRAVACKLIHHARFPVAIASGAFNVGKLGGDIAGRINRREGAAITVAAVIGFQPALQRILGRKLHLGVHRGADGKAAALQRLLTIFVDELTAKLLDEIGRGRIFRPAKPVDHLQRLGFCLLGVLFCDVAVFEHPVQHIVPACQQALRTPVRVHGRGGLGQGSEDSRLREVQFRERLIEIDERGRADAIGADTEIDLIQVDLENLVLGERILHAPRDDGFFHLAFDPLITRKQHVLCHLLCDGRPALQVAAAARQLDLRRIDGAAQDTEIIEAGMIEELLVLGGDEGLDNVVRNGLDGHEDTVFVGKFGDERAVPGMHPRGDRRLIVGKALMRRQVPGERGNPQHHGGETDRPQYDEADCHAPGRLPGQESSFRGLFTHGHVRSGVIVTKAALRRIPCPE